MQIFYNKVFQLALGILVLLLSAVQIFCLIKYGFASSTALAETSLAALFLIFLCYVQANLLHFYSPQKSRQLLILVWSLVLAIIWFSLHWASITYLLNYNVVQKQFVAKSAIVRLVIVWQFLSGIGFYIMVWQNQQYEQQIKDAHNQALQLSKDAELFKLRQQMQPHFLFNSLNSISALVVAEPKQARKMIQQLSDYLRATLRKEDKELYTLQDEITFLQLYLDIEQVRFGHRLQVNILVPKDILHYKVPALILQPVLENAIKYGLYNTIENVQINIKAILAHNYLNVQISNPFDAESVTNAKGTGFGLNAVNKRLHLLFGNYKAVQTSAINNVFTTTILIPKL